MQSPPRDDHILPVTRVLFGLLALVVLPFFVGLTFYPEHTDVNFAWKLGPRMAALVLGGLYFAVVYSFLRVAFAQKWHHVALVLWATLPVLAALGVISWRHWDKFTDDPWRLGVWVTAYMIFPPILCVLLVVNLRRDPRTPDKIDVVVPQGVRRLSLVLGLLFGALGAALMFYPVATAEVWPWPMKPLAAQAIGALFLAPAAVQLVILREERWSALKLVTEAAILWFSAILVGVVRCWDEFDTSRALTWFFVGFLVVEWGIVVSMYLALEKVRRAERAAQRAIAP